MSQTGVVFVANVNADKIYIDMSNIPDPVRHTFKLRILNQSNTTLYFKIICNVSNWSLQTPSDGKLGSIGSGGSNNFDIVITREKPSTETIDSGYFTIQAFTDSGYNNKVSEDNLNVTVYFEDLENWTDVIISDFNNGTSQGWTLSTGFSVSNDKSVETGGYSIKSSGTSGSRTMYIEKQISIPNRNKVRLNFYLTCVISNSYTTAKTGYVDHLSVKCDGNKVFEIAPIFWGGSIPANTTYTYGWSKFCCDISAYRGLTVVVRIEFEEYTYDTFINSWIDRIVIAGKN
jgi:hypothetical protein